MTAAFQGVAWTKRWHPCMGVVKMRIDSGMGVGSQVAMCHSLSIPRLLYQLYTLKLEGFDCVILNGRHNPGFGLAWDVQRAGMLSKTPTPVMKL